MLDGFDLLLLFCQGRRLWFWAAVVVIVLGVIAIAGNLLEPSLASF